jgi:predicted metal-dependent hydrolase
MNHAQSVDHYLRRCAELIGLRDWSIKFDPKPVEEPEEDDTQAMTNSTEDCTASVRFAPQFWSFCPKEQRAVIAHELCHLHTNRLRVLAEHFVTGYPKRARGVLNLTLEEADEHVVESIARLLTPMLPLPHFSKPSKRKRRLATSISEK